MQKVSIIGAGNMGMALARGWVKKGVFKASDITIYRRNPSKLHEIAQEGFSVQSDYQALASSPCIVLAILPQQLDEVLVEVGRYIKASQLVISVVSGATCADISSKLSANTPVVRVMPNTAMAIGESMTTIAADDRDKSHLDIVGELFKAVGEVMVVEESLMTSATALCACGIAFFLRAIRAASQGGVEIGFHAEDAIKLAAQTAKGAAALLLANGSHPEHEIDKVTSPKGCTIAGLNEMEHSGFSSSLIKGIRLSAAKAGALYTDTH